MLDHRGDAGIAHQRRAERPEPVTAAAPALQQLQRDRGASSSTVASAGSGRPRDNAAALSGPSARIEQPQPDAGQQHLRVDEAGAEIEQRARAPPRDRPGQRKSACPALEILIRKQPVAQTEQPVVQR